MTTYAIPDFSKFRDLKYKLEEMKESLNLNDWEERPLRDRISACLIELNKYSQKLYTNCVRMYAGVLLTDGNIDLEL